ncbi:MAG: hypothetical protein KDI38_13890 [Calditrichaeota bacterium]|nr:hypothetical protein [Calditrichota bacterium]
MTRSDDGGGRTRSAGGCLGFLGGLIKLVIALAVTLVLIVKLPQILKLINPEAPPRKIETVIPEPIPWDQVDDEVRRILENARKKAQAEADLRLTRWTDEMMVRVDDDFLEWYFDYWNQQVLGLKSIWYWSLNQLMADQPTAAEGITEDIQLAFAQRVLRPQVAQLELERITRDAMEIYVYELRRGLDHIPKTYQIPQGEWDRYLEDLAILTGGVEGNREVDLTLKALTVGGASGAVLLAGSIRQASGRFGSKLIPGMAGKSAAKLATRTGRSVLRKTGGRLLGPIIGIGILIWDYWDHSETKRINKPILRQAIADYFHEMKGSLLYDNDTGIMSVIHKIEIGIVRGLDRNGIPATKPANPASQDSIIKPTYDDPLLDPSLK